MGDDDADAKRIKGAAKFAALTSVADALARPVSARGSIVPVVDGKVYYVEGSWSMNMGFMSKLGLTYIGKTMTIVKDSAGNLTLFNCMALTESGYAELDTLGKVTNIVRLSTFHGSDVGVLLDRYKDAKYWDVEGMQVAEGIQVEPIHMKSGNLPLEEMEFLTVPEASFPTAVVYLKDTKTLVTCDFLQNQSLGGQFTSYFLQLFMKMGGFLGEGKCGPGWLNGNYAKGKHEPVVSFLKNEIATRDIDILCPGHGLPLVGNAGEKILATCSEQFKADLTANSTLAQT